MPYPYTPPDFLKNQSVDKIHQRMLAALPDDIDKSENQIPWDYTRPAAIEKAEFVEFELNEGIKVIFPQWAYDEWLDLHAQTEGITRRPANRASGTLTLNGVPGTTIAEGFQFATQANLTPSVIFEAAEQITLDKGGYTITDTGAPPTAVIRLALYKATQKPLRLTLRPAAQDTGELLLQDGTAILERYTFDASDGADQAASLADALTATPSAYFSFEVLAESDLPLATVTDGAIGTNITIQAVEGGAIGNVPPDTVMLMVKPESGISHITNAQATSGGTPEESDDELRERILDTIRRGISFTGCDADYIRWAKEVPGVGQVVVDPEWDDPNLPEAFHWTDGNGQRRCAGAVRLFIIDANGLPANQQILDAIYDHIINPSNRIKRLAPIEATLTVAAPSPLYIDITATVTLKEGENLETVKSRYKANLDVYWLQATTENDLIDVQSGTGQNRVKYVYVGSTLAETAGIANYQHSSLTVNGGTDDIPISLGMFPVTREVTLNV